MYGASLSSAFNSWDAFWRMSSMCLLNFSLQVLTYKFKLQKVLKFSGICVSWSSITTDLETNFLKLEYQVLKRDFFFNRNFK